MSSVKNGKKKDIKIILLGILVGTCCVWCRNLWCGLKPDSKP